MATLNLTDTGSACWRIWAANLRDAGGTHSEDARLLCRLLDLYEQLRKRAALADSANNLGDGVRACVEQLVGRMLTAGAAPPKQPAALK
jgi:hypothetical protein